MAFELSSKSFVRHRSLSGIDKTSTQIEVPKIMAALEYAIVSFKKINNLYLFSSSSSMHVTYSKSKRVVYKSLLVLYSI